MPASISSTPSASRQAGPVPIAASLSYGPPMEFTFYQRFKDAVIAAMQGVPHDLVHVALGPIVFVAICILARRRLSWWPALIPVFALASGMEALDIAYMKGRWGWLPWRESLWDLLITTAGSVVIWLLARRAERRRLRGLPPEGRAPDSAEETDRGRASGGTAMQP